jgi:hypothetical protein
MARPPYPIPPAKTPAQPTPPRPMAVQLLDKAADHMTQRAVQYNSPQGERSMARTVGAFNIITGHTLSEAEGFLLMQILKDVRQWHTPGQAHVDSIEDCVSYAALKGEALINQDKL